MGEMLPALAGRSGQVRNSRKKGAAEVQQFLSTLTTKRNLSASNHNQAHSASLFCSARRNPDNPA